MSRIERRLSVPADLAGRRLDQAAAALLPEFSRSRLRAWIDAGELTVGGREAKPRMLLKGGERARARGASSKPPSRLRPSRFRSTSSTRTTRCSSSTSRRASSCIPAPAIARARCRTRCSTRYPELALLPRAGLVHRLDKDTSGLLLVARTLREPHGTHGGARAARDQAHVSRRLPRRADGRRHASTRRSAATGASARRWPSSRAAARRARITACSNAFARTRTARSSSRRAALIRFACTWRTSARRCSAIPSTAAGRSCRRPRATSCAPRCKAFDGKRCTRRRLRLAHPMTRRGARVRKPAGARIIERLLAQLRADAAGAPR